MSQFLKINSISELHDAFRCDKPSHPLISVINLSDIAIPHEVLNFKVGTPFYNITFKSKTAHPFRYGRGYFDFSEGFLIGLSPNQIFEIDETSEIGDLEGWSLFFHPDLIRGYNILEKISEYGFFSYEVNEALHMSEKEKKTLNDIVFKIKEEYESNLDEFSQDVLVSNIELLFNYIRRFYSRQFITRKKQNTSIVSSFNKLLKDYFEDGKSVVNGLPKVHYFAEQLHLSDSYLSDLLKKETGKNTQDLIHFFVIERAKNNLVNSNKSVSEIAFDLGFEYPQYFSRLFKNKTGQTPKEYRDN
ncbi:helix-turn-helix domain-containing protein [Flammeovirga agarivorans]|uniref:Helix-turn-helix transcriptional regulator n=1 Tax=Flammeovirga agarivorans TaxID=2726742 RepID=A0A7X8SPP4_9BACT|nr:helix-turn-helix transcriptional regulator [Flammeovirga agarivorans]NLR94032.1 helix-turn-helix transcriptional regulator [Flammeovirga agarivorans]